MATLRKVIEELEVELALEGEEKKHQFANVCVIMWSLSYFDLIRLYLYCRVKNREMLKCFNTLKVKYYFLWKARRVIMKMAYLKVAHTIEDMIYGDQRTGY